MPEVGDSLGRYTLLQRLASGGMGEVFLAAKPGPVGFGPRVALKVLREQLASDQTFIDMLVDEANISMFLNHQNVVSVLDLAEDRGTYYIAMEFVQGVTVEGLLERLAAKDQRLELSVALYIASELCRALKYAHTRVNHSGEPLNIIHRDVTPANILLSIQGEVKLTDFGIARAKGRIHQTQAGVLKGKFGYMAPEMIRYEAIDARADLFCAGVVIYLMITGRHPVAGATVMEAIQRYEDKQIPRPSSINPEVPGSLDAIVMRALEPRPDNRWASAASLAAALQDLVLRNPALRRDVQDGASRLSDVIRELAPEVFQDPVSPELAERFLEQARESGDADRRDATGPVPTPDTPELSHETSPAPGARGPRREAGAAGDPFNQTTAGSSKDSKLPPVARGEIANPELETEEGLALAEVFAARQELLAETRSSVEEGLIPADGSTLRRPEPRVRVVEAPAGAGGPLDTSPGQRFSSDRDLPRLDTSDMMRAVHDYDGVMDDVPTGIAQPAATMALPAFEEHPLAGLGFLESATDRHRIRDELIAEPNLSWADAAAAGEDGRTVVGMPAIGDDQLPKGARDSDELAQPLVSSPRGGAIPEPTAGAEGQTEMRGFPDWGDPTGVELLDESQLRARAGSTPPPDPNATRAYQAVDAAARARAGGSTGGEGDDAETVIPLGPGSGDLSGMITGLGGAGVDLGDWARDVHEAETNDATLLDGVDASELEAALARQRAEEQARGGASHETELPPWSKQPGARGSELEADGLATDSDELDLDAIVARSMESGTHAAPGTQDRTVAGAISVPVHSRSLRDLRTAPGPSPSGTAEGSESRRRLPDPDLASGPAPEEPRRSRASEPSSFPSRPPDTDPPRGPALLAGPLRIAFRDDGSPVLASSASAISLASAEVSSQLETPRSAADAAALLASSAGGETRRKAAPVAREKRRAATSEPDAEHPSHADAAAPAGAGQNLDVGAKTGRWMAGQLDAAELEWDDDAAARRAVATRNKPAGRGPGQGGGPGVPVVGTLRTPPDLEVPRGDRLFTGPGPSSAPPKAEPRSTAAGGPRGQPRSWPVIFAVAAAFLTVGVVAGILVFTRVLWPKLKLESDPPGARVIVDDVEVQGTSPVVVQVEPERPHSIEFRLEGHYAERREITDGVGRGRTYALQVSLRRMMPELDMGKVSSIVFVNDREVGRGARVALTDLPLGAPVRIRVEAPGYHTWQSTFDSGGMVPETVDVPMTPLDKPEGAAPPGPQRRR